MCETPATVGYPPTSGSYSKSQNLALRRKEGDEVGTLDLRSVGEEVEGSKIKILTCSKGKVMGMVDDVLSISE